MCVLPVFVLHFHCGRVPSVHFNQNAKNGIVYADVRPPNISPTKQIRHFADATFRLLICKHQLRSLDAARYPVRPKLHLLSAHVVPFARSHLWWGLISEQGVEHVHRMCNNLAGRYAHLGDPEKVVEKLAKHLTLLNALHDRGVEKNDEE
uniref:Secreted protein n=1 Tax=Globodera rostochiensis TaxID=31243 RepID=A0A914HSI4_GLORO